MVVHLMARTKLLLALFLAPVLLACGDNADRGSYAEAATAQGRATPTRSGPPSVSSPLAGQIEVGYRRGSPDAPVAVVEFSDFGCPYCGRFAVGTFPALDQEYIEPGLVRWRYVPVSFGFAGGALMGAAAECAGRLVGEEAFWRAHDILYRHQAALRGADAQDRLLDWLAEGGLDRRRLEACIRDPATAATLDANNRVAEEWFVRGTPTFLVNGVPMSGAMPTEFFRKVLDTALDPSGL
jgi:protein-disulfide isomerase